VNIVSNAAELSGGGIASFDGSLTLTQSAISENVSGRSGGGIFANETKIRAFEVVFNANSAARDGGAIALGNTSDVVIERRVYQGKYGHAEWRRHLPGTVICHRA
jgi:predicted outer membrane repeat protein